MKTFIKKYKYLFIGGIMGFAQQFVGRLDYFLYKGHDIFSFSDIMGGLSIYALIILFTIKRDVAPKQQFRDLFLFFLGLDFFYYLYIFFLDLINYFSVRSELSGGLQLDYDPFQNTKGEIFDFFKWTFIGTCAAVWGVFATKFRNGKKKKLYSVMMLPLFAVMVWELAISCKSTIRFFIQEYKFAHGTLLPEEKDQATCWSSLAVSLLFLIFSIYKFIIAPRRKKENANEVNT